MTLEFAPISAERWHDFEKLFCTPETDSCWCMYWRLTDKNDEVHHGEDKRQIMHNLVADGETTGILAYVDDQPVGWCSIAPRERYPRLLTSPVFKALDSQPVWTVVCFFVAKSYRRRQLSAKLLDAAIAYAIEQGAQIIEACPVDAENEDLPEDLVFTGVTSAFEKRGFVEVARRSEDRPLMRLVVGQS